MSEKRLSLLTNGNVRHEFKTPYRDGTTHRARATPKGNKARTADAPEDTTPAERRAAMTWAQRLKRVFTIDIETCKS